MSEPAMKLHWSARSPFVRKVMIVLHETGLLPEVELVRSLVALHLPTDKAVLAENPLGKIPVLVTDEGAALFDSRVICEFLDLRAGGGLFPVDPHDRFEQLRWQALADGLIEILLLWRTELTRPQGVWPVVTANWATKVETALDTLNRETERLAGKPFGIGQIAVICALGQLDFRWLDCVWREHFSALADLEKDWASRPSVAATQIVDDGAAETDTFTAGQLRFGLNNPA